MLSKEGEIRRDEACLDFAGTDVILYPCHGSRGNQFWMYNHDVSSHNIYCTVSPQRVAERSSALPRKQSVPRGASSNPGGFGRIFRLLKWLPEVGYNPAVGWSKNLL